MSRAFTKEDAPTGEIRVPDRAPLPRDSPNYVTPHGLQLLKDELRGLEEDRSAVQSERRSDPERLRQLAIIGGKISKLQERLDSARPVDPREQPSGEVRFGATVTLVARSGPGGERRISFTIAGVDEASSTPDCIAFTAPIARAIIGHGVGETVELPANLAFDEVEIREIRYDRKMTAD